MASVVGAHDHGRGDLPAQQAAAIDCHRHLSFLLSPLHDSPERLATRLLYRFGSIARIAQASEIELRQAAVGGEKWADALIVARQLMHDGARERLFRTRLGEDPEALCSYLLAIMQNLSDERMMAVFADADGFVIAEEVIAQGNEAQVLITPRRIFGRALNLDARRILLAHNHPSGSSEPSLFDIKHTKQLCRQALELGLEIEDHLIVGCRQVSSMKARGLI